MWALVGRVGRLFLCGFTLVFSLPPPDAAPHSAPASNTPEISTPPPRSMMALRHLSRVSPGRPLVPLGPFFASLHCPRAPDSPAPRSFCDTGLDLPSPPPPRRLSPSPPTAGSSFGRWRTHSCLLGPPPTRPLLTGCPRPTRFWSCLVPPPALP